MEEPQQSDSHVIFLRQKGEVEGPFEPDDVRELLLRHEIPPTTLARHGDDGKWTPSGGAGNEDNTKELARFIADRKLKDYGLGVIQLDDWWQNGPKIDGPATHFDRVNPNGPYKNGIAPVASFVEEQGITFGLWWLPFGRNHMEPAYQDKQDWFVKWPDGKPLRQKSFGGNCLDTTNPAVEKHLEDLGRTIRSWGGASITRWTVSPPVPAWIMSTSMMAIKRTASASASRSIGRE